MSKPLLSFSRYYPIHVRDERASYEVSFPASLVSLHARQSPFDLFLPNDEPILSREEARARILAFEQMLLNAAAVGGAVEMPVTHYFAHGVYGRECFIAKDTFATGKIHKHSQITVIVSGDLLMFDERQGLRRLKGGDRFVTPAGVKRAVYAREETIILTFHGTYETDQAKLEKELIAESYEALDQAGSEPCHGD